MFRILDIILKKLANSGGLASGKGTTCPSGLLKQHQMAVLRHSTNTQSKDILKKKVEAHIGDYVVVLVSGKSRALKHIARVNDFDDEEEEYEGVF